MALATIDVGLLFDVVLASASPARSCRRCSRSSSCSAPARPNETRRPRHRLRWPTGPPLRSRSRRSWGSWRTPCTSCCARASAPAAASSIVRSSATASSSRRSWRDEQQRAVVGVERGLELLDRRQVEVVRRLVEHEPVRAGGHQQREARARALARGEACGAARATASALEPELGQQRARLLLRQPAAARRRRRAARPRRRSRARAWSSIPIRTPGPIQRVPAASGRRPRSAVDQRRLAAAVRPDERDPLAPRQLEVERAEHEAPAPQLGALEARGHVARALAAAEAQLQLPAPPRLVHLLEPLDRLLGRAHLRRLLLRALGARAAAVLVRLVAAEPWPCARPVSDHWRWRRARSVSRSRCVA